MRIDKVGVMWTREDAETFLSSLRRLFRSMNAKVRVVGSVAAKGYSRNDLDVEIALPEDEIGFLVAHLDRLGYSVDDMTTRGGSRVIRVETTDGKFVDFFPRER